MPFSNSSQCEWFDRIRHLYQSLSLARRYALLPVFLLGLLWSGVGHELGHLHLIAERESRHDVINLSQALAEEVGATVASIDLSLIAVRSSMSTARSWGSSWHRWIPDTSRAFTATSTLAPRARSV